MLPDHFKLDVRPTANPAAMVTALHARFTVLTSRLLRLEYSPIDHFEDRASQVFWYRDQPVPEFSVEREADRVVITTEHLRLTYCFNARGFTRESLSIELNATGQTWKYGDRGEWKNLRGTARTLDDVNGALWLERGLLSRDGWAVIDDSGSLVFNADDWLETRAGNHIDLYFFGYGHEYIGAIQDFYRVSGRTPLIPRYILGNWWSRYWAYTQDELINLMRDFKSHEIPLSICIVDMDWHITETGNDSSGWTGYTWNRELFPDPRAFIAWLHEQGLRTALNLHPADGVFPHEAQYAAMAEALGIDPASQQPIDFDIADPKFLQAYFDILHHPYEELGVDFWWIDWQQGTRSKLGGLDPLMALNHLHYYDLGRDGSKRPFIFSRWFGLGNQRYPIGFSGDSVVSWESLAFQPYFTATASNVGYGWWSHDIGGHMSGIEDGELYARWIQFGVFSPILRLHSTNNPYQDRRPWLQDDATFQVMRAALQLRHQLIPYLYTMAWRNTMQGAPLIAPMYYEYPEDESAYRCPQEYRFGTELIVAPFTSPIDPDTRLSRQQVWLPNGEWYDFFTADHYIGGRWITYYGRLDQIPVFAKGGAIVPLAPHTGWGTARGARGNPETLEVHVFPPQSNRFELYEDDGETTAYLRGQHCVTTFELKVNDDAVEFIIEPGQGDVSVVPQQRTYRLIFHRVTRPVEVASTINGASHHAALMYDEELQRYAIEVVIAPGDRVEVTAHHEDHSWMEQTDRREQRFLQMLRTLRMESDTKRRIDQYRAEIFEDPDQLKEFGAAVKDAHIEALRSVIESEGL
jgi:alpha-glucosidase (family GH31 glycosyl hydrolase)